MATLRKSGAYSRGRDRPYTRKSKKKSKSYIKTVPASTVVKFNMGNIKSYQENKFPFVLHMVSLENVQIRANSLEACRQYINKQIETNYPGQYYFKISPYPHHIQRENKMLTGAGADRMQTGMQLSFGKTIARAAFVKTNHPIFTVATSNKKAEDFARKTLKTIKSKLPCRTKIISEVLK